MSYQGSDKWLISLEEFQGEGYTQKQIKDEFIRHIKEKTHIDVALSQYNTVSYEIINVKLTIRRKIK
jgi:hypothetical protein